MDGGQGNQYHIIIHSFARALCTVLLVLRRILASGLDVNLFLCVVEFANNTRLAKFAKIKPREIYGVYSMLLDTIMEIKCLAQ